MKTLPACGLMLGLLALAAGSKAADEKVSPKEALQALQEFIGEWKGSGGPDKPKVDPKDPIWSEAISWTWRFKGDDAWLSLDVKNGKYLKGGELRYLPAKQLYQLTLTPAPTDKDKDPKKQVFEGKLDDGTLTLERVDPDTKETQQVVMNTAAEGVRFIYRFARKAQGTTIYKKEYLVAATREGQALGAREKKNVCVVSGGLGTMAVSYKGETFYVCCSGCRDAFNENPEKYIAEFKAKKK
jgi:hypothetical protein